MKVKGISHITFICKDLDKSSNMLTEIFGAIEIYDSGDQMFSLSNEKFFDLNGLWVAIMEGNSIEKTYNHIALEVDEDDLPKFIEKIELMGLEILPGRKRKDDEGSSLYFYDFDNHLFELHTGNLNKRLQFYKKS